MTAHGGEVWVRTHPGEGATFAIALPLAPEAVHHPGQDDEPDEIDPEVQPVDLDPEAQPTETDPEARRGETEPPPPPDNVGWADSQSGRRTGGNPG